MADNDEVGDPHASHNAQRLKRAMERETVPAMVERYRGYRAPIDEGKYITEEQTPA